MKIIKKFTTTITLGVATMNVNMLFGSFTDEEFDRIKLTFAILENAHKNLSISNSMVSFIMKRLSNTNEMMNKSNSEILAAYDLLCLGCDFQKLEELMIQFKLMTLYKDLKDNKFDKHRKDLEELCESDRQYELDLRKDSIFTEDEMRAVVTVINLNKHVYKLYLCTNGTNNKTRDFFMKSLDPKGSLKHLVLQKNLKIANNSQVIVTDDFVEALEKNESLTRLELLYNDIDKPQAEKLSGALKKNNHLEVLLMHKNNMGNEGAIAIGEALKENQSLKGLRLSNEEIGAAGAIAIGKALEENSSLCTLILCNNKIGFDGAKAILESNRNIRELDLSYNELGKSGAEAIAEMLKKDKLVYWLNLRGNNFGSEIRSLVNALKDNKHLHHFGLGDNNIGDVGAEAFKEVLVENKTLQYVDLSQNSIGNHGAVAISDGLDGNHSITSLNLDENKIGDIGAEAIAKTLKKGELSLMYIKLEKNPIGTYGWIEISKALKYNRSLVCVDFGNNNIGDHEATAFAEAFSKNNSLVFVNLSHNNIGDAGAIAIATNLKTNKSINWLCLEGNHIKSSSKQKLEEAMEDNITITKSFLEAWDSSYCWQQMKL